MNSLNHIYRTIWSEALGAWVAVSELTKAKGKPAGAVADGRAAARSRGFAPLAVALACCFAVEAQANPTGAQVVNGAVSFAQNGSTLTITNSPSAIINWQGFSIGKNETTNFIQQSANSAVLNRVVGSDPSVLLGALTSNGKVFLINPSGILVGQGARIDVAGLVASTLNLTDSDFLAGKLNFGANAAAGAVKNAGSITTPDGGTVYLIAPQVENSGIITTPKGETILAAGSTVQLLDTATPGVTVQVTGDDATATNLGQILADSGRIGMVGALVKNSGTLSASSLVNKGGRIFLQASKSIDAGGTVSASGVGGGDISVLADKQSGTVNVTGTLDASASAPSPLAGEGGGEGAAANGGFIETSAANVHIADSAKVTTLGANGGTAGTWLIDPQDFTIAASGGDITGATLSTELAGGAVIIQSSNGAAAGNGDIFVDDTVSWSSHVLTLSAYRNIEINATLNDSGTAGLALQYGQGAVAAGNTATYTVNAPVNLASTGSFSTQLGSDGATVNYTIITSLGTQGSTTGTNLQGINGALSGNYVLGANIDASATATWNSDGNGGYYGFTPVGNTTTNFTGVFDGLGHTITGLTEVDNTGYAGLFGISSGTVKNVGLLGAWMQEQAAHGIAGGLVGQNVIGGSIVNAYATGTVSASGDYAVVGGLVGYNAGSIGNAYAAGTVSASGNGAYIGGLVGQNVNGGSISNAYATGAVSAGDDAYIGGLVGDNVGSITNTYATGTVSAGEYAYGGGLIGNNEVEIGFGGPVAASYWNSDSGIGSGVGMGDATGITGKTLAQLEAALPSGFNAAIWGNADNQSTPYLLNLANNQVHIATDWADTLYTVILNANQLQAMNNNLAGNYALGANIDASATAGWNGGAGFVPVGSGTAGFVGTFDGLSHTISGLTEVESTTGYAGLFGYSGGTVRNVGLLDVSIQERADGGVAGGLVGVNDIYYGSISNAYATGTVSVVQQDDAVAGGLVGINNGSIENAYANVAVSASGTHAEIGGLAGFNNGSITKVYATGTVSSTASASEIGGLVGENDNTVTASYWNTDTDHTGLLSGVGSGDSSGVVGLTTAQMTDPASFCGWDLATDGGSSSVWRIYAGSTAPLLRSFLTPLTLTPVYDGSSTLMADIGSYALPNGADVSLIHSNGVVLSGAGANGYNATLDAWSTQQGYDLILQPSFIPSTGGAGDVVLSNALNWTNGSLTINATHIALNGLNWTNGTLTINAVEGSVTSAAINGGSGSVFNLKSGNWTQVDATLPTFAVNDFRLGSGTTFVRALGGDGSGGSPYQLADIYGVQGMGTLLGQNFVLANDIDASGTAHWNGGAGFNPVGNSSNYFSGSLDGQGHIINQLTINRPDENNVGLFGYIGNAYAGNASISNVGLTDASVAGLSYVGGLVGYDYASYGGTVSIDNAYVSGSVTGNGNGYYVGGLVGYAYTDNGSTISISNVHSSATVAGGSYVGGLAGEIYAYGGPVSVSNAYATGAVTGRDSVGGLIGQSGDYYQTGTSTISDSYASGAVTGSAHVGGLVGYNWGSISYAYATGTVTGVLVDCDCSNGEIGGLVGYNSGSISNVYVSGNVSANQQQYVGGLIGYNDGSLSNAYVSGTVTGNYSTTGVLAGYGGDISSSQAITAAQLESADFWTDTAHWDVATAGGSSSAWRIYDGYTAPLLRSLLTPMTIRPAYGNNNNTLLTGSIGAYVGAGVDSALISGTSGGLTLSSNGAGSYVASFTSPNFYSSQQGYDLTVDSRTISTPGSAAGDVVLSNPITYASGSLAIDTSGAIAINAALNGGSGLLILKGASASQTAPISVAELKLVNGSFVLTNSGNAISTLAGNNVSSVSLDSHSDVTVGTVGTTNPTTGLNATGDVSIATDGALSVAGAIGSSGGSVTLSAVNGIAQNADISALHNVVLTANANSGSGDFVQTAGIIENTGQSGSGNITINAHDITVGSVSSSQAVALNASDGIHIATGGGTAQNFTGQDDNYFSYTLPFGFTFYGVSYTTMYVSSNGVITFGNGTSQYTNSTTSLINGTNSVVPTIAPAWSDWVTYGTGYNTNSGHDIYIGQPTGSTLAVKWDVANYNNQSYTANFEAVLAQSGNITFNYGASTAMNPFYTATIGVSKGDGVHYTLSSLNNPSTLNDMSSLSYSYNTQTGNYVETVLGTSGTVLSSAGGSGNAAGIVAATTAVLDAGQGGITLGRGIAAQDVALLSDSFITSSAGAITATDLAVRALGNVTLDTVANSVTNLAAQVGDDTHTNGYFYFTNSGDLNIGTGLGAGAPGNTLSGISLRIDGNFNGTPQGVIGLISGGALTQSQGALLGGRAVYVQGASVDLTQANPTGVLAGEATNGSFSYTSSNPISVTGVYSSPGSQSAGVSVVSSSGGAGLTLTGNGISVNGSLSVSVGGESYYYGSNDSASITLNAGSGPISLEQSAVAVQADDNAYYGGSAATVNLSTTGNITLDSSYIFAQGGSAYATGNGGAAQVTLNAGNGVTLRNGSSIAAAGGYNNIQSQGGNGGSAGISLNGGTGSIEMDNSSLNATGGRSNTAAGGNGIISLIAGSGIALNNAGVVAYGGDGNGTGGTARIALSSSGPGIAISGGDGVSVDLGGDNEGVCALCAIAGLDTNTGNQNTASVQAVVSDGGIALGGLVSISGAAATSQVVLAVADNFINTAGSDAIVIDRSSASSGGRWLIYASNPSQVTKDGLTSDFRQYDTAYGDTVNTATGDGFIYASPVIVNTVLQSGSASSTYGSTPTAVFGYALSGLDSEDANETASGTAAFTPITGATNAGTYTVGYLGGLTTTHNYALAAGSGVSYTVNPALLDITAALTGTASKTYDGTTVATLTPANFILSGFANGDSASVTQTVGTYASKNVGTGILITVTLSASNYSPVGATNLSNYILPTSVSGAIGVITVRPLSIWTGQGTNNLWSNPANWDVLPDGSNVLAVSLPAGSSVSYDAAATSVLQAITNAGSLALNANLNVGSYVQTAGSLSGSGNFTVGNNFSVTGGTLALNGSTVTITQATGNLNFTNTGPITVGGLQVLNGNLVFDNTGGVNVTGAVVASGALSMVAHSPLTIGSGGVSAGGNIVLTAGNTAGAGDDLTLNGAVSTSGTGASIALLAGDNLAQNANVSSSGGAVSATAQTGNITMATGTRTSTNGGALGYSATGNVVLASLNAGSGAINLTAGGNVSSAPGTTGPNLVGGTAVLNVTGNATLSTQVQTLVPNVGGSYTITDSATGAVESSTPVLPTQTLTVLTTTITNTTTTVPSGNNVPIVPSLVGSTTGASTTSGAGLVVGGAGGSTAGGTPGTFGDSDTGSNGSSDSKNSNGSGNGSKDSNDNKGGSKSSAKPTNC